MRSGDPIRHEARFHKGIDIPAASGTPVVAAADGVVAFAGVRQGYGFTVEITHPGHRLSRYAHLARLAAVPGQGVSAATVIGFVGSSGRSTGPHLHFEYWIGGRAVDPVPYFARASPPAQPTAAGMISPKQHLSAYQKGTLWLRATLPARAGQPDDLSLIVHSSRFDHLGVAFTYADGAVERQHVRSGDFGAHWRAGGQLAFRAPRRDAALTAVTLRFRPMPGDRSATG